MILALDPANLFANPSSMCCPPKKVDQRKKKTAIWRWQLPQRIFQIFIQPSSASFNSQLSWDRQKKGSVFPQLGLLLYDEGTCSGWGVQCSELGGSTNIQWISNNGKKRVQFLSSGLGPLEGHARQRQALEGLSSIEVGQQQTRPA